MKKLTREDLLGLEEYTTRRSEFRRTVMDHKKSRKVSIGPHATAYFEDRLTVQYQVQEMLRVERLFEPEEIADELSAYNPLIPDGMNWKATFMIEVPDETERKHLLARLVGIEDTLYIKVDGFSPVYAIADEDLDRENGHKTSSVHFVRFELTPDMAAAVKHDAPVEIGIEHEAYSHAVEKLPDDVRQSLVKDLD